MPKDVTYGDSLAPTEAVMEKFRRVFKTHVDKKRAVGVSKTKMRAELGHGSLEANDVVDPEQKTLNLLVMKRIKIRRG